MTGKLIVAPTRKAPGATSKIAKAAMIASTTIAFSAMSIAPAQAFFWLAEKNAREYTEYTARCYVLMLTDTERQIEECNPKLHPTSSGSIQSLNVSSPTVVATPEPEEPVDECDDKWKKKKKCGGGHHGEGHHGEGHHGEGHHGEGHHGEGHHGEGHHGGDKGDVDVN